MKRTLIAAGLVLGSSMLAGTALAGPWVNPDGGGFFDYAKVVQVEPLVRMVRVSTPRRECWDEDVIHEASYSDHGPDSYAPMVLGGIVGGVVGNRFGHRSGRDAMTIAGTLLGAAVGRDLGQRPRTVSEPYVTSEQRCRTVDDFHEEERIDGYRVTYRYQGHEFVRQMDHDPGRRLRVRVAVTPVD